MAQKYTTLNLVVSKTRQDTYDQLSDLSDKLGCKPGPLVWQAIEALLQNPPTEAPAGAQASTGSASGFWVRPIMGDEGAVGVEVVEVDSRGDVTDGRQFFRYGAGDEKQRTRSLRQAIRAAHLDCQMLGIEFDEDSNVKLLEFTPSQGETDEDGADLEEVEGDDLE